MNETNATHERDEVAHMDAEIDPSVFEGVVADTWIAYLDAAVEPCDSRCRTAGATGRDARQVEARIRISGETEWEVSLGGSWNSAKEATRRMLKSDDQSGGASSDPECVLDAWGELVNTLAGNFKAAFGLTAHRLSMPEVFRDPPAPATTQDAAELQFEWDGYCAVVRFGKITLA